VRAQGYRRWFDAASADLAAFHAHGGKLILFMGWDDPVGGRARYRGLLREDRATRGFRAALHGAGHVGTALKEAGRHQFLDGDGAISVPPVSDARHGMAIVLENWVEKKQPLAGDHRHQNRGDRRAPMARVPFSSSGRLCLMAKGRQI